MIRAAVFISGNRLTENDFSSMSLNQKIGVHHTFEIRILQEARKDALLEKAKLWIGEEVSLGIDVHVGVDVESMPIKEVFKGIVTSIELSRKKGSSDIVVKGHSPTIIIDDGPASSHYLDSGLQEIIDSSIQYYALPEKPIIDPKQFTSNIEYVVQYNESPFQFMNRLANRYGEWFYYDGVTLYFGLPNERSSVDLDFDENGLIDIEMIAQAKQTGFVAKAYDYNFAQEHVAYGPESISTNPLGKEVLKKNQEKIFTQDKTLFPNENQEKSELDMLARRNSLAAASEMIVVRGRSTNCLLKIGVCVDIQDKSIGEKFGKFIITELSQSIGQNGDYSNTFEAYPAELESPPVNGPLKSPFCESQEGVVAEIDDPDGMGRVRVYLLNQEMGQSEITPWIRVMSPYTGSDKGFYTIPEKGDWVLVAFEANNPDKPYVISGHYGGGDKPKMFDSENRYKGIQTRSGTKLRFDDKHENVLLSAPNELTLYAGNKITLKTKGEEDGEIHVNVGEGTVSIVAKHVNVESAESVLINSGENLSIQSGTEAEFSAGKNINVTAGDDYALSAGKKLTQTGGDTVEIAAKKVTMDADVSAEISSKDVVLKSGGKMSVKSASVLEIKGTPVKIN